MTNILQSVKARLILITLLYSAVSAAIVCLAEVKHVWGLCMLTTCIFTAYLIGEGLCERPMLTITMIASGVIEAIVLFVCYYLITDSIILLATVAGLLSYVLWFSLYKPLLETGLEIDAETPIRVVVRTRHFRRM